MFTFVRQLASRQNRYTGWIAILAALGGFLFGFDTGVVGSAEPYFSKSLGIGSTGVSWVVGSLLLGAVGGAALSGWLADAISRKWTIFVAGCIFTVAAIGSALASNVEVLCAVRFLLGIAVGTASFVAPMYIAEQSAKELRGGMIALNQVMIALGIFAAYLSDFALSGVPANWRWMFAVEAIPGVALAVAMLLVPYSPRWLVQQGRRDDAHAVLARTRPGTDTDAEAKDIEDVARAERRTRLKDLLGTRLRPFLVVGLVLAALQQLVGINAVIYFGAPVLKLMGLTTGTAVYEAISLGAVNFVGAVVAALLLDRVGRRPMLIVGSCIMIVSLGLLGWYFSTGSGFEHQQAWIGLVCILGFLFGFEISLGPVFWLMISELYPLGIRSKAMALATMCNWSFNFLVSYFFLTMTQAMGTDGTFWLFGGFAVCALVFTLVKVPETRNRSLEQIEQDLGGEAVSESKIAA